LRPYWHHPVLLPGKGQEKNEIGEYVDNIVNIPQLPSNFRRKQRHEEKGAKIIKEDSKKKPDTGFLHHIVAILYDVQQAKTGCKGNEHLCYGLKYSKTTPDKNAKYPKGSYNDESV
jgi:hypothetical protein